MEHKEDILCPKVTHSITETSRDRLRVVNAPSHYSCIAYLSVLHQIILESHTSLFERRKGEWSFRWDVSW